MADMMTKAEQGGFTGSGVRVERVYGPERPADGDPAAHLGEPGEYPYTRGCQPAMYRSRLWTMRQYAGFGTAQETNARFRYLLANGQTGLSTAFDLPTQMGYDSDDPLALGEVGRTGVAIDTMADMEILFDGIALDQVSTSMTINAPAAVLLAMYQAVGEKQGVDPAKLSGTTQNDILKEYIARNTYIFPPGPSMRLVTDIFAYCADTLPRWNTISISGYHMREAGCTAIQEVAFTLANARTYVQAAIDRGLDIDRFAPQLSFFFCAWTDVLEEVAKFRAARRLWARIMREEFGAKHPRSWQLRFHTQTAGSSLTAQQPDNNIVRTALSALAAILGGTQSLHTNAKDEALALPTEQSALTALRTQQLLAFESGATATVDPLGGSYYIEALTDQIEAGAREYFDRIDREGGSLQAIAAGFFQREIQDAAYRYQRAVERQERIVVGVNRFQLENEPAPDLQSIDPAIERAQVVRLAEIKAGRDGQAVARALAGLEAAARGQDNLMPPILAAVKAYASVGEICGRLRQIFGKYKPPATL
ncbi:MAG: methylmalonyl-CoA mutase family protein [Candidatus Sericytochromatia bacterium]|uniref:Methylmalonyl-CoA mutase family protein n=1 Tax=Candidatus Tanganyikabacteria bacterium TaxID=2961651 RepID=A0A937X1K1_9BACT|nr:methylmalonyl-CoA mutase family protein [Candidatus Tanganyikabacteria bacterium]